MANATPTFAAMFSPKAETQFMATLMTELPELKPLFAQGHASSDRIQAALAKAMASVIAEAGPTIMSVVKTEDSLTGSVLHVSPAIYGSGVGTARDLDVRFQVQTALKNHTYVEHCARIDLHTLRVTQGIPLFDLGTCLEYAATSVRDLSGLARLEIIPLLEVINGMQKLHAEANLEGMPSFEGLTVSTCSEMAADESFFDTGTSYKEVVEYLRQVGRKLEEDQEGATHEFDKCAHSVALYQLAYLLESYPEYLQDSFSLMQDSSDSKQNSAQ